MCKYREASMHRITLFTGMHAWCKPGLLAQDTWLMKTAGDLPVHNQKYLPPASAGHAGASTPQEFIHCSPIVSAFVGSFFDPVSTFL